MIKLSSHRFLKIRLISSITKVFGRYQHLVEIFWYLRTDHERRYWVRVRVRVFNATFNNIL